MERDRLTVETVEDIIPTVIVGLNSNKRRERMDPLSSAPKAAPACCVSSPLSSVPFWSGGPLIPMTTYYLS